jgi:starch synthase
VYAIDLPEYYHRSGFYLDSQGQDWPDNPQRFAVLCRVAEVIGCGLATLDWAPSVVHLNDWQTGLAAPMIRSHARRPALVCSVHNLAYQGTYDRATFESLALPWSWWTVDGVEYHGGFSFLKAGLVYADKLTTVSPTYAEEIKTPEYGRGLDGVLRHRSDDLMGILNGIDRSDWDPRSDPWLPVTYSARNFAGKVDNRRALQREFGLPVTPDMPVIGMVTRLTEQKGIDLVIDSVPWLMQQRAQLVVLGAGDSQYETALRDLAGKYPDRLAVRVGYDEQLSHRIEGGADLFLMPSRFEPCGLNQMYSLAYGTPPVVRRTGGLADTVQDATPENLAQGVANGFVFDAPTAEALQEAVGRALLLFSDRARWMDLVRCGMEADYSWDARVPVYQRLYALASEAVGPVDAI